MRQQEFMQELETGLRGRIADEEAQDILAEYRSFFVSGAAENKSEEDICGEMANRRPSRSQGLFPHRLANGWRPCSSTG